MAREKSTKTSGIFPVESLSALQEFALYRPEAIEKVEYKPQAYSELAPLLARLPISVPVTPSNAISRSIRAMVALELFDDSLMGECTRAEVVIVLDHIEDPRNFGAIVRTAAFYRIPWIIVPKDRQALLSSASVASSQGGFARTKIMQVVNIGRTITTLKSNGYWVVALSQDGSELKKELYQFDRTVIVVGSEGRGISANVQKKVDFSVRVGPTKPGLDSLNVSVAFGIGVDQICGQGSTDF